MNTIDFFDDGGCAVTADPRCKWDGNAFIVLSSEDVRKIAEEYELRYAIEDVQTHLVEREDTGRYDEIADEYVYNREIFTPDVVRELAREVIDGKGDATTVQEAYWYIVDDVIDRFKERKD